MQENPRFFDIHNGVITGISYNSTSGILTSWKVDANSQSHKKTEETVVGNVKRIFYETKLPWISIADTTILIEESKDFISKRLRLEEHGEQKNLSFSISALKEDAYYIHGILSSSGNLHSLHFFSFDHNDPISELQMKFRGAEAHISGIDREKRAVVEKVGQIPFFCPIGAQIRSSVSFTEDQSSMTITVTNGSKTYQFNILQAANYQKLIDKITSPNSDDWLRVFQTFPLNTNVSLS